MSGNKSIRSRHVSKGLFNGTHLRNHDFLVRGATVEPGICRGTSGLPHLAEVFLGIDD